jgi:hypothetical protein
VSHNRISQVPDSLINGTLTPTLEELSMSHNVINNLAVTVGPKLRRLDVKGNHLTYQQMEPLIVLEFAGRMNLCHFYETVPQQITDTGIFLGSAESARNFPVLQKLGIGSILNAAFPLSSHCAMPDQFAYCTLNLEDSEEEDIMRVFGKAYEFIENSLAQKRNVLIHCQAGVSRSVAIAASYLMKRFSLSAKAALQSIQARRPHAKPITHFVKTLEKFELEIVTPG